MQCWNNIRFQYLTSIVPSYASQNVILVEIDHCNCQQICFPLSLLYNYNIDKFIFFSYNANIKSDRLQTEPMDMDIFFAIAAARGTKRILARTVIAKLSLILRLFLVDPSRDTFFNGLAIGQFARPCEAVRLRPRFPRSIFFYPLAPLS